MTFQDKLDALRRKCEALCGGAIVGPPTAYWETSEDSEGNTLRFRYWSQVGRHQKEEDYDKNWKAQQPLTVKADIPTHEDIDACVAEFFEGFRAIATEKRKAGEGLVWRVLPVIRHDDDGFIGIRARYVFAPKCKIIFLGPNGGIQDLVPFEGGS